MVRKYKPEGHLEWDYGCYEDNEGYIVVEMQESGYGEWVMLSTYLNEQKRLQKQIDRLKRMLSTKIAKRYIEYRIKTSASNGAWEKLEVAPTETNEGIEELVKERAEAYCVFSDHYRGYEWRELPE